MISWLNIFALPYTLFSVYYQWKVAKQWCILCLAVQGLLLLGGANCLINFSILRNSFLSFDFLLKAAAVFVLPGA
ncbi:MAG TPA: hypothetical protein VGI82_13465 [Chitinophagaceae bacterium]